MKKLLTLILILFAAPAFGESKSIGIERLDNFYTNEFNEFNEAFEIHIQQLDKCLSEMDKIEKTGVVQVTECNKFSSMKPEAISMLEDIMIIVQSRLEWLNELSDADYSNVEHSDSAIEMVTALAKIYTTKYEQAVNQTNRIGKNMGAQEFIEIIKAMDLEEIQ